MSVSLSDHLPLLAEAPDGIKKLRGLILELAVRGKLVPQDPKDEPASELLKQIAKVRARLDEEGTCKKHKVKPLDDAESPIFTIAPGWDSAPLGDVVDIVRGITFPSSEKSKTPEAGRVRCLRTANVQNKIEWDDILYIRSEFVSRNDQTLCPNDIVMSMANSRELVGKVALVENQLTEPATFGGFLGVLRPHLILPRFVMAFLRAPTVRSSLIDSASQTTNIANISLAKLRPLSFPIPPLAEQHRIVAKVDELMALCDRMEAEQTDAEAVHATLVQSLLGTLTQSRDAAELTANWQRLSQYFDTLFTTEASLDTLKQTILQLAVMGKLVSQDPKDEPASELVKRIVAEKARLVAEGKIRKDKPLPPVGEDEKPFKLPDGWEWAKLGFVGETNIGLTYSPSNVSDKGTPVLRSGNIQNGKIDLTDLIRVNADIKDSVMVKEGDLLICARNGSRALVGKTALISGLSEEMAFGAFMAIFRSSINLYLLRFINSPLFRKMIDEVNTMTINQITQNNLRSTVFPLPPLAEQHRIVAKVDELMALCDSFKADLAESRARQARLASTLIESALQAA